MSFVSFSDVPVFSREIFACRILYGSDDLRLREMMLWPYFSMKSNARFFGAVSDWWCAILAWSFMTDGPSSRMHHGRMPVFVG